MALTLYYLQMFCDLDITIIIHIFAAAVSFSQLAYSYMAKYTGGALGTLSGKLGAVVFRKSLGQDIAQAYQPIVKNPRTDGQLTQRFKISGLGKQAKRYARCVKATKASYLKGQTSYSYFVKKNYENQESTANGTGAFDYENAVISEGDIYPPQDTAVTNTVSGTIQVSWENAVQQNQETNDKVFVFAIPADPEIIVAMSDDAEFTDGLGTIGYGSDLTGEVVHIYVCTINPITKRNSNTVWVGAVTLS